MKVLCLLVLISSFSYAGEVVWQTKKIGELTSSLSTVPLYMAKRFRLVKIEKHILGKPISSFYLDDEKIYRNYQNGSLCYKVVIEQTRAVAYNKRCDQSNFFITLNDKRYDEVLDLTSLSHFNLSQSQKIAAKSFLAFHHQADEILGNLPRIDRYPFSTVLASISKSESLKINKKSVSLASSFKLTRSPFTFHLLTLNHDYLDYLATIENDFFQTKETKKCFRDNLLAQNQHDCDYLLFKKKSLTLWKELGLVKVSEEQGQLKT